MAWTRSAGKVHKLGGRVVRHTQPPSIYPPTLASIAPNTGPEAGGTPVTITGAGFSGGVTAVFIGSSLELAGTTVVNDTTITGSTPAQPPGAYQVSLYYPRPEGGNGAVHLPNAFTYT